MAYFVRVIERVSRVSNIIGYIFLAVMMLLTVANILLRSFGGVIVGSYSIVVLIAVLVVSPAIIYTQLQGGHIAMEFVISRYPHRIRIIAVWIAGILCVGLWGLAAWIGLEFAWEKWVVVELLDPLDIPVAPFRFIWGIALFLLCLASVASLLKPLIQAEKEWKRK